MCKGNSPDKSEASTGCVRETPQSDKNEASTGSVRETHQIKMKPAWDVYWMKPLSTGCVRETLLILFRLFIFLNACPAAPPKGAEQDKHKMMIEQSDIMHSVSWKTEVKHGRLSMVTTGDRVTACYVQGFAISHCFFPQRQILYRLCTSPSDETTDDWNRGPHWRVLVAHAKLATDMCT